MGVDVFSWGVLGVGHRGGCRGIRAHRALVAFAPVTPIAITRATVATAFAAVLVLRHFTPAIAMCLLGARRGSGKGACSNATRFGHRDCRRYGTVCHRGLFAWATIVAAVAAVTPSIAAFASSVATFAAGWAVRPHFALHVVAHRCQRQRLCAIDGRLRIALTALARSPAVATAALTGVAAFTAFGAVAAALLAIALACAVLVAWLAFSGRCARVAVAALLTVASATTLTATFPAASIAPLAVTPAATTAPALTAALASFFPFRLDGWCRCCDRCRCRRQAQETFDPAHKAGFRRRLGRSGWLDNRGDGLDLDRLGFGN